MFQWGRCESIVLLLCWVHVCSQPTSHSTGATNRQAWAGRFCQRLSVRISVPKLRSNTHMLGNHPARPLGTDGRLSANQDQPTATALP